jgi:hypothetical protein
MMKDVLDRFACVPCHASGNGLHPIRRAVPEFTNWIVHRLAIPATGQTPMLLLWKRLQKRVQLSRTN